MKYFKRSLRMRGWTHCTNCKAARNHLIGYAVNDEGKQVKAKQCCGCGHISERKPKTYSCPRHG